MIGSRIAWRFARAWAHLPGNASLQPQPQKRSKFVDWGSTLATFCCFSLGRTWPYLAFFLPMVAAPSSQQGYLRFENCFATSAGGGLQARNFQRKNFGAFNQTPSGSLTQCWGGWMLGDVGDAGVAGWCGWCACFGCVARFVSHTDKNHCRFGRRLMDNDLRIAPNVVLRCVGSKELHRGLAVRWRWGWTCPEWRSC